MIRRALKLSELAPVLVFALAAAFVGASLALHGDPSNPVLWQVFMTLLPVLREPVYLAASIPGIGYGLAFAGFIAAALAGCWLMTSRRTLALPRFVFAHTALLALLYSMGHSKVFQAEAGPLTPGPTSLFNWSVNFDAFPFYGVLLFALVALPCAACHVAIVRRLLRRKVIERDVESRLMASLEQFA